MSKSESRRGNQVVLPILLIVAGVLVLAGNLGWLAWGSLPFLGTGSGAAAETHDVQIPIDGAERAEITIRVGVSQLDVSALSGGNALVSGQVRTANGETFTQDVQRRGGTAEVDLLSEQRGMGTIRGGGDRGWDLALAQGIPTELGINTGVGRSQLDLRDVALTGLDVDAGVGEMVATLPLPTEGSYQATFDTGVGATTVRVPEDAAVRIAIDTGLGGVTARGGFDALGGDVYQTPGFSDANERIDIRIDGGVGAITIERVD